MFTFDEILDLAIRIEHNGEAAYRKAQNEVLNPDLAPVLQKLADDEKEHVKWFQEKINNRLSRFYIAQISSGNPVGQVRFDLSSKEAVISISVDKTYRKLGYGAAIIRKSCLELFRQENVDTINAFVKNRNKTSRVSFLRAGFKEIEEKFISGHPARHFVLIKDKLS